MKKINFEELMASVSEQFVEEAASFSPIKAFNIRFVALAACIAIIVTAIPAVVILNREKDVDAPKVTTPVEDIVVTPGGEENTNVIYVDSSLINNQELINLAFGNQGVDVFSTDDYRQYNQILSPGRTVKPDINVPPELNFTVSGMDVEATLESVYYTLDNSRVSAKDLRENNKIASYTITSINGESRPEVLSGLNNKLLYNVTTAEIVSFHTEAVFRYAEAELSEKELMDIVEKDITQLYGKDFLEKYSVRISSNYKKPTALSEGGWQYAVVFDKKFWDFNSGEQVMLMYNGDGKLFDIYTHNMNSFETIESKLTKEVLDKIEEKAILLLDGRLVESKIIERSTDGDVYAHYSYFYREGDKWYSPDRNLYGGFAIKINLY